MKHQISSHDYELISAYLDNQLSERDRALLEYRLKSDTELQMELEAFRKTRQLIQQLPKLRAPRNYYIKAHAVQPRPSLRLAPVFGIVSALSSVLLALVIFGSTFYKSIQPVALAPAVSAPQETQTVLQSVPRSAASEALTTEAAPPMMMTAPLEASPTEELQPTEPVQTEIATPTTIHLYAYLPTGTPEGIGIMGIQQDQASQTQCEGLYGSGAYPTLTSPYNCPTPTPSETPTPTGTSTSSNLAPESMASASPTASETPTQTPTPTETPTATPTETPTSSPSPSPMPSATELPPVTEKLIPTSPAGAGTGLTAPNVAEGAGVPTPLGVNAGVNQPSNQNTSFLNYILLTVELSLASIAVISGVIAIIFRVRAGR